ncbi:hypothetical protein CRENBAI_000200 [Crenichthys baileyi]|uniref:Uncharacterized protein n=1 Tax=Crenichthys baileyi TaxID=28760 RepID=A0AAV9SRD8_9TELE
MSPGLAAAPPMPSSVRCSEAIPEDLEGHMSAAAEQPTSCLQTAAAAAEKSTPGLQPAAECQEGPVGGLPPLSHHVPEGPEGGLPPLPRHVPEGPKGGLPPQPGPEHLLGFLWGVLTELRPGAQPEPPQPGMTPDPKSASTSSTHRRGHRKRGTSAQFFEGLCDA